MMLSRAQVSKNLSRLGQQLSSGSLISKRSARLFSTSVQNCAKAGPDRTKSTAFTKKVVSSKKKRLLGPVESVSGLKVNEEYYLDAPVVEIDDLIPETATQDNLNKVLSLPGQFVQSLGHDNLPGNFKTVFKLLNKNALVYRPVADSIIQRIKSKNASQKPVIIDGTIGIGKSATLLTSVSLASSLGYLVIYAPNTNVWVDSSQAYFPNPKTNLFSQWSVASAFLKTIRSINKDVLEKIKIESEFVSGGIKLEAGSTLLSVIDLGISAPSQSHDCLELILDTASKQAEVPVLIAIDQVNTLFCQTLYTDQDNTPLQANRLRLVKSLIPFIDGSKKLSNGLSISATSKTETKVQSSDLAKIIKDNLEESKDIKVLDMPKLTFGETKSLLEYFNKSNLIYKDINKQMVNKKWLETNGNPHKLFKVCTTIA